jgi:hypothetical protein
VDCVGCLAAVDGELMPLVAQSAYQTKTYASMDDFLAGANDLYRLGWLLVSFAFQGTQVVAVFREQQVVSV